MSFRIFAIFLCALLAFVPKIGFGQSAIVYDKATGWRVAPGVTLATKGVETPEKLADALAKLTEARRTQDDGSLGAALSLYETITEDFPGTELAAESHFQMGVIYHARHQFSKSFENYEQVIRKHPEDARFDKVVAAQFAIATDIKEGKRPRLWGWIPWFKNPADGINYFETVNRNAPYGKFASHALYNKGLLALEEGKAEDAIDAFERVIHNYPASGQVADAYLALARTYEQDTPGDEWDQGSTRLALEYYSEFIARFPASGNAQEAVNGAMRMRETLARNRFDLALFYYEEHNNTRAAAIFFNEAINAAPESGTAREARKKLAEIHDGRQAPRGIMDWILGRYPPTLDSSYVDVPKPTDLQDMGFGGAKTTNTHP